MARRYFAYFAISCAFFLAGCGGGGAGGSASPFAGTYTADFTTAASSDTSVLVFVHRDNSADVTVSTDNYVDYTGSGTFDPNTMSIIANATSQIHNTPIQFSGNVVQGPPPTISLTLTGGADATPTLQRTAAQDANLFAGTYNLTANAINGVGGSGTITVSQSGTISGTFTPAGGATETVSGSIQPDGLGTITTSGGATYTFTAGFWFHLGVKQANGAYTASDGGNGTFVVFHP